VPTVKVQLPPLTGLRWILAMWVVMFHETAPDGFMGPAMPHDPNALFCLLRTGYMAVSIFFVLSGFILSYNYSLANRWTVTQWLRFGVARFARIYPAYFVGLLLMAPFVAGYLLKDHSPAALVRQAAAALLNLTLLQSWIPRAALSWNSPGWSLSVEAFFYCCFPIVGVALWKLSRLRSILIAGSLFWAIAMAAPLLSLLLPAIGFDHLAAATSRYLNEDRFWTNLLRFNPLVRLPDFCVGILLGRAYQELIRRKSLFVGKGYYFYVPGIVLEILAISQCKSLPYLLVHNGLFLPLHAMVILGLALGGGALARLLSTGPMIFLGDTGYSTYILHSPVARWMKTVAVPPNGIGVMVLYVLGVVCLSAIVFKVIEEPGSRILKRKLKSRFDVAPRERVGGISAGS
jgi:peptidoglycan/LPS O-acetylase OafA/YrhL